MQQVTTVIFFAPKLPHLDFLRRNTMATSGRNSPFKEMVMNCLEALSLTGISTWHFIEFKCLREIYEKEIEEWEGQFKEDIVPTTYQASIEDENLKMFIYAGWFKATSIDEMSEHPIKQCLEERCKRNVNRDQLYLIDQGIRGVSKHVHVVDAKIKYGRYTENIATPYGGQAIEIYKLRNHIQLFLIQLRD